ncbi:hypothetical protein ADAWI_83 [Mycobacterium phage Adawi]|uniref:Uncharacterized protein n=1 Tax=Mycobacterium phage Adawi TaxID=1354507 RepID=T2A7F9_9CAUD|nr:hypothetical protein ADAWI_83 [Mycobacterium phage Adawi]AGU91996.1 hypothetical protein ADAWI_83 [Mycobacterium phage Adawi]
MVNLLPGPTRDAMTLAKRAVQALEDIAQLLTHRETEAAPPNGWLPNMNPEVGVHAQLGCRLMFDYSGADEPVAVWCNTHDAGMPLILPPIVPPLDDADLAALRAKLEGN